MHRAYSSLAALLTAGRVLAEHMVTTAAQLMPRRRSAASDVVGYISENGGCMSQRSNLYHDCATTNALP